MEWYKIRFTGESEQVTRKIQALLERVRPLLEKSRDVRAALFERQVYDDQAGTFASEVYFSPAAMRLLAHMLIDYMGSLCEQPRDEGEIVALYQPLGFTP